VAQQLAVGVDVTTGGLAPQAPNTWHAAIVAAGFGPSFF
jgi:hypothetical protein